MLDIDLLFSTYLYIAKRLLRRDFLEVEPALQGVIIDLGCGHRPYQRLLGAGKVYIGIDYESDRRPHVVGDVLRLPLANGMADSVTAMQVLEHVPEPDRLLAEAYRILKPTGVMYVTVPMMHYLHYEPNDYFRFTQYGIGCLLQRTGFSIERCEMIGTVVTYWFMVCLEVLFRSVRFLLRPLRRWDPVRDRIALVLISPVVVPCTMLESVLRSLGRRDPFVWSISARKGASNTGGKG